MKLHLQVGREIDLDLEVIVESQLLRGVLFSLDSLI